MSLLQDAIQKLNQIPPLVHSVLHEIRQLDKKVEKIKSENNIKKDQFFRLLEIWKSRKSSPDKETLDDLYIKITQNDQKIEEISKQKVKLAENLYNLVHQPTQKLGKDVCSRKRERNVQFYQLGKKRRGKRGKHSSMKEKWDYGSNEPSYCYCGKESYGQMVQCENPKCERQWFHVECLGQKLNRNTAFYCKQCRKSQPINQKSKKIISKGRELNKK